MNEFFPLPRRVSVNGRSYPIRTDAATALAFTEYVDQNREEDDEAFLDGVLKIWYPEIPPRRNEAIDRAVEFYCGGRPPKKGYYQPFPKPEENRETVYVRFLTEYGIDLNRTPLHWWIFRRLVQELREQGKL